MSVVNFEFIQHFNQSSVFITNFENVITSWLQN